MKEETLRVAIEEDHEVTTRRTRIPAEPRGLFLYAPGAGSGVDDPFGVFASRRMAGHGILVIRFQFPYRERGRKRPDGNPLLERTWRRVVETFRLEDVPLVVGGRSMGGRIASQVVSKGEQVDGLALFAYPLHAPATPERWRDAHLSDLRVPTLFCSGTRDAFASAAELEVVTGRMHRSRLHLLEGADHGFRVLKSSGRKWEQVWDEAVGALLKYHFPAAWRSERKGRERMQDG